MKALKLILAVAIAIAVMAAIWIGTTKRRSAGALELLEQLRDPSTYFEISTDRGYQIAFREPSISADSLTRIGLLPSETAQRGKRTIWEFRFMQNGQAVRHVTAVFEKGLMAGIRLPDSAAVIVPPAALNYYMRVAGISQIDFVNRRSRHIPAEVGMQFTSSMPTRTEVLRMLGEPTRRQIDESGESLVYEFLQVRTDNAEPVLVGVTLHYSKGFGSFLFGEIAYRQYRAIFSESDFFIELTR